MKQGQEVGLQDPGGTGVAFIVGVVVVLDGNKWHSTIPRRDVLLLLRCPSSALDCFASKAQCPGPYGAQPILSLPLSYFRRAAPGTWT
jgi:hypothetical protein